MNAEGLPLGKEVFRIAGVAMAVINAIGHGLHEKPYENALVVEFTHPGIPFAQPPRFPVRDRDVQMAEFVPDLIVSDAVIVDAKLIGRITDHERGQMMNSLRITGKTVGVILNFKRARLEWERIVISDHSR